MTASRNPMEFFNQVFLIARKDLLMEVREGRHFLSVLLFGVLLLLLFSFALSVDPDLMRRFSPGLFWLAVFFTSVVSLDHSFRTETEGGQWEGLLLLGTDPKAIFLGKFLANLSILFLLQVVLLPFMKVLFELNVPPALALVLVLGSVGIACLGTFYAGLTAVMKEGQLLLPLLLYPMLIPVLLASVKATELIVAHDLFGQEIAWLKLLILFDTVFLLGSIVLSDALFDVT